MSRLLFYPLQALLSFLGLYGLALLYSECKENPDDTGFICAIAAITAVPLALAAGVARHQRTIRRIGSDPE
jgi:hypothetical protein